MHSVLVSPPVEVAAFFVWIHMLRTDTLEAARRAADDLRHERILHFHDPRRRAGKAIGRSLQSGGAVVWDTYLLYRPGLLWVDEAPAPVDWAHQLDAAWADPSRFRRAENLPAWLRRALADT